jgi:hypothetical protein
MTYKEYDNVFLDESGTSCQSICYLRNGYGRGVEQGFPPRNIAPVAGYTTIYTGGATDIVAFVANNNYIYFYGYREDEMYAIEYNIDTTETIEIFVAVGYASGEGSIAFIEDRKVLIISDNDYDYTGIFIVDFETGICTLETSLDYPFCCRAVVVEERIWLYAMGFGVDGMDITYKNYTDNGSWNTLFISVSSTAGYCGFHHPFTVGSDYIVFFEDSWSEDPNYYSRTRAHTIQLSDNTVIESAWIGRDIHNRIAYTVSIAVSESIGKCYAVCSGYRAYSFPPYYSFEYWVEYDPYTNTIGIINYIDWWEAPPEHEYHLLASKAFSSTTDAFIRDDRDGVVYNVSGTGGDGAIIDPYTLGFYQSGGMLDDNNNRIIFARDEYLVHNDVQIWAADGSGGQTLDLPDCLWFSHIGRAFIATDGLSVYYIV